MLPNPSVHDKVELAAEPLFCIGAMQVTPSLRQAEHAGVHHILEPRVMQVLVVLARAQGAVVSRDELVERCWDGRIVGENALQRIVSRIRRLATAVGGFELETITKVGYRLVVHAPADGAADPAVPAGDGAIETSDAAALPSPDRISPLSRRLLLGAAGLAVVAGGALVAFRAPAADPDNRVAAEALVTKGRDAMLAGLGEQDRQAVAYLQRATELAPRSATAWGALALGYHHVLDSGAAADPAAQAAWATAAARRAIELDAGNVDALLTLATIRPNFRNWVANEARLRGLMTAHPAQPVLDGALGWLLCDTGRWREAIACFRSNLARDPFHPALQLVLAWGLWGGGKLAEAEAVLADAARLWPGHRWIWLTRFEFLATTGHPGAALALIADPEARPLVAPGDAPPPYDTLIACARALQTRTSADIARAVAAIKSPASRQVTGSSSYVTYCCALGMIDDAFDRLERTYFGEPGGQPPPGPLSRRKTSILFSAKAEPLRRDPRYPALTARLGLDDYWRVTGTRPDAFGETMVRTA